MKVATAPSKHAPAATVAIAPVQPSPCLRSPFRAATAPGVVDRELHSQSEWIDVHDGTVAYIRVKVNISTPKLDRVLADKALQDR